MSEDEIFELAFDKAGDICGADPAYFGEEGILEIMNQINLLGYKCELVDGLIKINTELGEK